MVCRKQGNEIMKITLRVWILVIALILALLAIAPTYKQGLEIKSVERNSTSYINGLRPGMVLEEINSQPVKTIQDYTRVVGEIPVNVTAKLTVKTDSDEFIFLTDK